jgi:putative membrane protein
MQRDLHGNEHGPLILELDSTALPEAPSPAEAPPLDDPVPPAAEKALAFAVRGRRWGLGSALLALTGALVTLIAGVALTEFVTGLFARNPLLGSLGLALVVAAVVLLLAICLRELAALARLGRIETLRARAVEARETGSPIATESLLAGLDTLYRGRPDMRWARQRLASAAADTPDVAARLALAEQLLIAPLDAAAEAAIMRASRDVATATAMIPLALVDVSIALARNLRMLREIAGVYGGRAGWLGSWRLMRAVASHLIATGAVAVADDLLGPLLGGNMLAKLSRRFGEGAVNGALTARVGVAAMDVCRPMPFAEIARPNASGVLLRALKAWRQEPRR